MTENSKTDDQNTDGRKALECFVVENDDLLNLESRIGRFNIFDALGITRVEIRHSNFLAFILDPAESHGQGQLFLRAVLMDFLKNATPELRPLSPIDLDGTDLRGVEIKREWKNIDVLITCRKPQFVVVIENKVGSYDHSNQLNRYSKTVKDCYPLLKPLYVYLTAEGDDPSEETKETWMPYSYAHMHRVLKRIREAYQASIGDDVLVFLDHYLNLLGSRFMNDEELDDLCRKIYKNHRLALDLIWERVGSPESATLVEVVNILEQDTRWSVLYRSSKYVDFMPQAWMEWLTPVAQDSYPFCVHIESTEARIAFNLAVGPMKDAAKRREIISKLREKAPAIGFKRSRAFQVEGTWNRISATETIVEWDVDDKREPAVICEQVKKLLDELLPKLDELSPVLKALVT